MNKYISILLLSFLFSSGLLAQSSHKLLMDGDKNYLKSDYASAEISYHKALDKSRDYKSSFNLGNALFKQEKYEEAAKYYAQAADLQLNNTDKSKAYYNLGNALIHHQKIEEAIVAYKNGLRYNPTDPELKENLMIAKMFKKQAEEQQQEQQQNQDQQQDQENQDQEQSEEEQEQQENQDQQQQEKQDSTSQEQPQQDSLQQQQAQETELDSTQLDSTQRMQAMILSKEEAERLLQAAELEEKKVQEKMRMVKNKRNKPDKDW